MPKLISVLTALVLVLAGCSSSSVENGDGDGEDDVLTGRS